MHVYHQSTCTLLKNNFSSMLTHGQRRSHTVGHHHTWLDMVEHHRTDILLKNCCTRSNTVVHTIAHGRTRSHKIYSYSTQPHRRLYTVTQNLFLQHQPHRRPYTVEHGHTDNRTRLQMVAHGSTDDCTWSHTVTQKILSCQNGLPSFAHIHNTYIKTYIFYSLDIYMCGLVL